MNKKVRNLDYGTEAREKVRSGVNKLATAVASTLGPCGRTVLIQKENGTNISTKDGVSVAKEIHLKDPVENIGAQVIKEVSMKAAKQAGDGTTTATVLAASIYNDGLRYITAGANPVELKRGMDKATAAVVNKLRNDLSIDVTTNDMIRQVGTISANNDTTIGSLIAEAMEKVGNDGVITVEESRGFEMELNYKEGMQFDKGYLSPYFITNPERMEVVLENPYILITDSKISSIQELLPLLEQSMKITKNLVIIAEDLDGDALTTLVVNKLRGTISPVAIKAPGFGDRRKEMLEDIAVLTGATVISAETGKKLDTASLEDLGRAEKIVATKDETIIIGGHGGKEEVKERISLIKKMFETSDSQYDKEKLQERIAKLSGGVAVISVGANTEAELKEKKLRVEDAVNATKAAVEEGIVAGGGVTLLRVRKAIEKLKLEGEEKIGAEILMRALEKPLRVIVENAGEDSGPVIVSIGRGKDGDGGPERASMEGMAEVAKASLVDFLLIGRGAEVEQIELFPELPPDASDALAPRQLAPIFQFWTSEWKSPPGTDGTESAFLAGWSGAKRGVFLTDEIKEGLGRFKSRGKLGAAGESQDRTPAGKRATGHGDRVR